MGTYHTGSVWPSLVIELWAIVLAMAPSSGGLVLAKQTHISTGASPFSLSDPPDVLVAFISVLFVCEVGTGPERFDVHLHVSRPISVIMLAHQNNQQWMHSQGIHDEDHIISLSDTWRDLGRTLAFL
jgi:hypothetical protein